MLGLFDVVEQPVRGEDRQPRVLEGDQAHQDVAVVALAADLLGVDARGLVAVVAVGDQQLGACRAPSARARWRRRPRCARAC